MDELISLKAITYCSALPCARIQQLCGREGGRGREGERKRECERRNRVRTTCIAYVPTRAEERREVQPQGRRTVYSQSSTNPQRSALLVCYHLLTLSIANYWQIVLFCDGILYFVLSSTPFISPSVSSSVSSSPSPFVCVLWCERVPLYMHSNEF